MSGRPASAVRLIGLAAAFLLLAASAVAASDEDKDLELIPQAPPPAAGDQGAATGSGAHRHYLENALTLTQPRSNLAVPLPPPAPARWENQLFLDLRDTWTLADHLKLDLSDRANLRAGDGIAFPSHQNVRNDFRELLLSWQPAEATWLDIGRINLKSGVAVGYNPTDFFRTRAVVEPLTADPSVLREDRLGTAMLLAQHIWPGGSLAAAYAPQLTGLSAIGGTADLPSFNPMFDHTNGANRLLLKGSVTLAKGISPELLVYNEGNRTQFGGNLSAGLGQQNVLYMEWAGGEGTSLLDDALRYGQRTGTLPPQSAAVIPASTKRGFRNDLVLGDSWTPADTKLTVNLEYHLRQAGFSQRDWRHWFDGGGSTGADTTLWYIRQYAQAQQEPLSRHSVFLRADWTDAFVRNLEITALASVNPQDGSGFAQVTADYYLSRSWTIGALGVVNFGRARSEYGSLPQVGSVLLRLVHYL